MLDRKKQILVVDDHFEMREFLRSMLELSSADYLVTSVPSAEEGLLELHRTPFDLLVTDVRLPGMSGFELVRKVLGRQSELPVLMITAYASAQGRKEAEQLGVYRYFEKPLDTDALLAAVHATLNAPEPGKKPDTAPLVARETAKDKEDEPEREDPNGAEGPVEAQQSRREANEDELVRRLHALLSDTGAVETLLVGAGGQILYRAGNSDQPVTRLAQLLTRSLTDSFELAETLQSAEPFTIQYQSGDRVDVYAANVGRDYFLILLFDARARRGRIGTVWVFAQRAVKELRELLPEASSRQAPRGYAGDDSRVASERRPQPVAGSGHGGGQTSSFSERSSERERATRDEEEHDDLFDLLEKVGKEGELDLDGYWEEAAADAGGHGSGLTYEEAVRQGLLPPDLGD